MEVVLRNHSHLVKEGHGDEEHKGELDGKDDLLGEEELAPVPRREQGGSQMDDRNSLSALVDATHSGLNHHHSGATAIQHLNPSGGSLSPSGGVVPVPVGVYGSGYPSPYHYFNGSYGMDPSAPEHYLGMMQQLRYFENSPQHSTLKESLEEGLATPPAKKRRMQPAYPASPSPLLFPNHAVYSTHTNYSTGRFVLVEQPNVRQRKSYKNENRYVLPNPLTICARDDGEKLPRIIDGEAYVVLVNSDGVDHPERRQTLLVGPEGALRQTLDSSLSAHFSVKMTETSEGTMLRLCFTVRYNVEGVGPCEEKVLSRPFQVCSNRKKTARAQERPVVIDIKPTEGLTSQDTEVWIKGKGFNDKIVVTFGDKVAKVTELSENLISVIVPPCFDLVSDTEVQVVVSNKYSHESFEAEKKPTFTYYIG